MLDGVLNYIVLLGAAALAFERIFELFIKPRKWFKKRSEEKEKKKKEVDKQELIAIINKAIEARELANISKSKKELETIITRFVEDFFCSYDKEISDQLTKIGLNIEDIKRENQSKNGQMEVLTRGIKVIISREIWKIYYKYKKARRLPQVVKIDLDHLYLDYVSTGGNSTIPPIYKEMETWEIVGYDE